MSATNASSCQTVRRPRDSDGVGNALRNVFGGAHGLPQEWGSLLSRLDRNDAGRNNDA